jgi:DNA-binding CsgD family transcriptional regulator
MVDVNLLNGIYLTQKGGDSLDQGIKELEEVARHGTVMNRAKAYHQLAQTYLKYERKRKAEVMLDSLYALLTQGSSRTYIHIDYKPIINHYLKGRNQAKLDKYVNLMLQEQQAYKDKKVNYNLVEAIIDLQTGSKIQESRINQLKVANQHLWFMIYMVVSATIISFIVMLLLRQKREYRKQIRQADEKLAVMVQKLNQSNVEKEMIAQEINAFLKDKENRQELETLTPHILKEEGETKFRQCFELLYPLFLHRLREKVPSVTRREELLSMLIILKQDNKTIAELMAIAPRSVLMLRHRFRQKIGIATEYSLENFIEDTLVPQNKLNKPE